MKTFVTADLHLDHKNIIKYCNRPFTDVNKMNRILVNNWNNIISPKDTVYFLGDLSFHTEYWIPKLNGDITFIRGNHDKFHETKYYNNYVLKYGGIYFYLTHRPEHIPRTGMDGQYMGMCITIIQKNVPSLREKTNGLTSQPK